MTWANCAMGTPFSSWHRISGLSSVQSAAHRRCRDVECWSPPEAHRGGRRGHPCGIVRLGRAFLYSCQGAGLRPRSAVHSALAFGARSHTYGQAGSLRLLGLPGCPPIGDRASLRPSRQFWSRQFASLASDSPIRPLRGRLMGIDRFEGVSLCDRSCDRSPAEPNGTARALAALFRWREVRAGEGCLT